MSERVEMPLILRPLSDPSGGPHLEPLRVEPPGPYVLGRSSEASWRIPDPTVSRRHAALELIAEDWYVSDLSSRQGTRVNGRPLASGERVPVLHGDRLTLGAWSCRFDGGGTALGEVTTSFELHEEGQRVSRLSASSLGGVAQLRLGALMDICRALAGLEDRKAIAEVVARGAAVGAGSARALVVRQVSEAEYEVLASTAPEQRTEISRTLLAEAASGEPALLTELGDGSAGRYADSVLDLRIRSAFCAPIAVGGGVEAYLYLDTRGAERTLGDDALAFCGALAQLAGVAFERGVQRDLEERRQKLERDLAAARRAQELLMPERHGTLSGTAYAFESLAGRLVAGDLFDVASLGERRMAFFLGDVAGKGVGAAVLMAAAQSQMRSLLLSGVEPASAVALVNQYLHHRTDPGMFVTLLVGVVDAAAGSAELVDAGHGMCCIAGDGGVRPVELGGGMPLAVAPDGGAYRPTKVPLGPGERLIVFTDGLVEQHGSGGRMLGRAAALDALGRTGSPRDDVRSLLEAVRAHASGPLADDVTVASFMLDK